MIRKKRKGSYLNQYKDRLPEIEELSKQGHSMLEVSRRTGINYTHLKELFRATKNDNSHKALKQKYKKIRQLDKQGWSRKKLMEHFGYSYIHIYRIIKKRTRLDKK